ncbi:hypothetical protein [Streptomyces sp. NPDC058735]|uniref:alpha-amylase family glycosyl hydrolase n=1 Tax=unclassified Streptomyces TaxID=2593676 RepID=UPI0036803FA3
MSSPDDSWWRSAVIYHVYIRSFADGDIVPNHTSDQNARFHQALAAAPGPERDRFMVREGRGEDGSEPPDDRHAAFGGPTRTRTPEGQ